MTGDNAIAWAKYLAGCRLASKYHSNLSAAARAACMAPSLLHRIEGAEVEAAPAQVIALLRLYQSVPPVTCACGRDLRAFEVQGQGRAGEARK